MTDISTVVGVRACVAAHLGIAEDEIDALPTVATELPLWQHITMQAALDRVMGDPDVVATVRGVPVAGFHPPTLGEVLVGADSRFGPVQYAERAAGVDATLACITSSLVLLTLPAGRLVAWVRTLDQQSKVSLEVKGESLEAVQSFLADMRRLMAEANPYRGHSLKVVLDNARQVASIGFQPRPRLERDALVLPAGVLDAVDAHAIAIGKAADRLRAAGRHVKRGLLLHGPPGTGKTHTVRYIASQLPEATLFVLTGGDMLNLKEVGALLAEMAPAIVVLDDVDLVAEDRQNAENAGSTLFDLLDAMDGMREDLDVLFVCTSNRANALEEAIAARPGRIDQVIEIPPPDAEARRRLIDLYAAGLELVLDDPEAVIRRTEGVTASFIKELLRRATVMALAELQGDGAPVVRDAHVHAALDELLDPSHPLFRALLGVHDPSDAPPAPAKQRGVGAAWSGI